MKKLKFKPTVLRTKVKRKIRKKIVRISKFILIIIVISAGLTYISVGIYRLIYSDIFRIKQIEIEGLKSIQKEKFLELLPVKIGTNLLETYFSRLEQKLIAVLPIIKHIKIKRTFPDKIKFIITEREPIGIIEKNSKLLAIDDESVCFSSGREITNLPKLIIDTLEMRHSAVKLLKLLKEKDKNIYFTILKLYNLDDTFVLVLKNNLKLFWGSTDTVSTQLKYLNRVLQDATSKFKNIEYIDLRLFKYGRIILKPTEEIGK